MSTNPFDNDFIDNDGSNSLENCNEERGGSSSRHNVQWSSDWRSPLFDMAVYSPNKRSYTQQPKTISPTLHHSVMITQYPQLFCDTISEEEKRVYKQAAKTHLWEQYLSNSSTMAQGDGFHNPPSIRVATPLSIDKAAAVSGTPPPHPLAAEGGIKQPLPSRIASVKNPPPPPIDKAAAVSGTPPPHPLAAEGGIKQPLPSRTASMKNPPPPPIDKAAAVSGTPPPYPLAAEGGIKQPLPSRIASNRCITLPGSIGIEESGPPPKPPKLAYYKGKRNDLNNTELSRVIAQSDATDEYKEVVNALISGIFEESKDINTLYCNKDTAVDRDDNKLQVIEENNHKIRHHHEEKRFISNNTKNSSTLRVGGNTINKSNSIKYQQNKKNKKNIKEMNIAISFEKKKQRKFFYIKNHQKKQRNHKYRSPTGKRIVTVDTSDSNKVIRFFLNEKVYGYPESYGGIFSNYLQYIKNQHPLSSICYLHKLHPFQRKHRIIVFLCSTVFGMTIAFLLLKTSFIPFIAICHNQCNIKSNIESNDNKKECVGGYNDGMSYEVYIHTCRYYHPWMMSAICGALIVIYDSSLRFFATCGCLQGRLFFQNNCYGIGLRRIIEYFGGQLLFF